MKPGKAQRMAHDYKRNGTTSLYAALAIGEVTGACYPRHTHLKAHPRRLHVVLDNSSTHSTVRSNAGSSVIRACISTSPQRALRG